MDSSRVLTVLAIIATITPLMTITGSRIMDIPNIHPFLGYFCGFPAAPRGGTSLRVSRRGHISPVPMGVYQRVRYGMYLGMC